MKKENKTRTEILLKRWQIADKALNLGQYAIPVGCLTIYSGVNWNEWLNYTNGWQLGVGFSGLLLSIFLTVFGLTKYDEFFSNKLSKLVFFGVTIMIWGAVVLCLANLLSSLSWLLICTGGGIVGGGVSGTIDVDLAKLRIKQYTEALAKRGVEVKTKKEDNIDKQVDKDIEQIKKRMEAVE